MFRALGVIVLVYVGHALFRGEVYARHRWSGRMIFRDQSPGEFSAVIAIYILLGLALCFVF
jgi:hypothetical protein